MSTFIDLITETADLYSFLLNVLIDVYRFPEFDIADEEPCFVIEFSENSRVKKYSDPSIKIDGIMIRVFLDKDVVSYKTFLTTNLAPNYRITSRCEVLGYKQEFKVFTSRKDVLDECLRIENAFVQVAPTDLQKSEGECSICNMEKTTLLAWPCYSSHTVCEDCTAKIIQKNCVCPFCRSVLPTTVVAKDETKEETKDDTKDDTNDYESDYESDYDYEYIEDGVDEEEKYFSKHRK
jgi:hypothetical protein